VKYEKSIGKFEFALIGDVPYGVSPGNEYAPFDNLIEVETFSSSKVHWLRVQVDPESEQIFTITQEIVETNQ
jgi:hypothetical protein